MQPLCLPCRPDGRVRGLELPRLTESPTKLKNKLCCQGSPRDAGEMNNVAPASNLSGFEKLSAQAGACLDGFIGDLAFLRLSASLRHPRSVLEGAGSQRGPEANGFGVLLA